MMAPAGSQISFNTFPEKVRLKQFKMQMVVAHTGGVESDTGNHGSKRKREVAMDHENHSIA